MDLNSIIASFKNWIDALTHSAWFGTALTILIILVVCIALSKLVATMLRKILKSDKGPLPSVSIFVNIARVTIWVIGLSIVLSSCFNVNLGAAITALGIGGIAISLGFQSTLSNLIGGVQIIIIGLIEPGDHINVSNYEGIVHDVTWRHTTIITSRDERVIIPNSVINSEALVKLPPETDIRFEITLKPEGDEQVGKTIKKIENSIKEEISKKAMIVTYPEVRLIGQDHTGYRARVTFAIEPGLQKSQMIDAAMKAIDSMTKTSKA